MHMITTPNHALTSQNVTNSNTNIDAKNFFFLQTKRNVAAVSVEASVDLYD